MKQLTLQDIDLISVILKNLDHNNEFEMVCDSGKFYIQSRAYYLGVKK
jgi:hypothetical protein